MEDYVPGTQFFLVWFSHNSKFQLIRRAHPGASHIQLAVAKHLSPQPHPHVLHRLALCLVDGDCERGPYRELPSLPLEWIFSRFWDEGDARNGDHPARIEALIYF